MTIHRLDDKKKRCLAQLFLIRLSLYLFLFLGCFPRSVYGECCLLQVNGQICNDTALVFIYNEPSSYTFVPVPQITITTNCGHASCDKKHLCCSKSGQSIKSFGTLTPRPPTIIFGSQSSTGSLPEGINFYTDGNTLSIGGTLLTEEYTVSFITISYHCFFVPSDPQAVFRKTQSFIIICNPPGIQSPPQNPTLTQKAFSSTRTLVFSRKGEALNKKNVLGRSKKKLDYDFNGLGWANTIRFCPSDDHQADRLFSRS